MTTIAIAGTGRMGTAFAKRLIETSHSVTVWNRTPDRASDAVAAGADLAADLAGLTQADIILVSLTDAAAVNAVIDGLIDAGLDGKLIVDMSTLLPDDTRAIAAKVTAAGAEFVDCPVGGTVGPALKGQLLGMAGGTEAAVARARPVLDHLCKRVEHLGPAGAGASMKLAVNLPLALYWQTLAEAMALLDGSGITPETAISVIADSSAGPAVLKNRAQVVIDTLNGTDQPGTFDLNGLSKDLGLALQQAERLGRKLPISAEVQKNYAEAIEGGLGGFDGASLTRHLTGH
ncbi:NAD(P)-dependent oxidoreductase [Ponticoccus sp. SC2-23]|uniref:NAD(P)-dependent oxidoreductase n=1 Tax=Alexandriicola marinus TaxID=2081710 RepID=UPI000FD85B3B|nr:NAD(P)-dependent oxidoreductase [Alexandriicola marinus]MBM1218703.1 NAD(P)-dependent oxidoreductase [Ponticoccus sp. SC6-9]MBM1224225.1 NAD(P)-dependent oxidoreductase [Ponticoccus sp. SC6-15]MBM1229996.1 NAD(P)-dependent oxidoreductase [Ponticoccus sp. SC6-38]MBM1233191.1 NAD(P)-dependent oxidoreductase [Ponticoccus sp. SC6-45]MBM1236859.1 NAD(P)-dependent oxidoreductase [Ponticoccus sp. SC6-49]MBM1242202.1 NAD(P)-dependent oxidoreductase [Ponticoccus sp. SC2-64]MBM1246715.1 NAD(P)-depe